MQFRKRLHVGIKLFGDLVLQLGMDGRRGEESHPPHMPWPRYNVTVTDTTQTEMENNRRQISGRSWTEMRMRCPFKTKSAMLTHWNDYCWILRRCWPLHPKWWLFAIINIIYHKILEEARGPGYKTIVYHECWETHIWSGKQRSFENVAHSLFLWRWL